MLQHLGQGQLLLVFARPKTAADSSPCRNRTGRRLSTPTQRCGSRNRPNEAPLTLDRRPPLSTKRARTSRRPTRSWATSPISCSESPARAFLSRRVGPSLRLGPSLTRGSLSQKFVARRARKFTAQGNRLTLPGIELAYVLNCLGLSPRYVLFDVHLDQVSTVLADLHQIKDPKSWGRGDEFWDGKSFCSPGFVRAVADDLLLQITALPTSFAVSSFDSSRIPSRTRSLNLPSPRFPSRRPTSKRSSRSSESSLTPRSKTAADESLPSSNVLKHGRDIQHDHHLVWFARASSSSVPPFARLTRNLADYELGRLYDAKKEWSKAKEQYDIVMSGKNLELGPKKSKGKVSLQNMAVLR